jgi:hypothetical protein
MNIDNETPENTGAVRTRTITINPDLAHSDAFTLADLLFRFSECVIRVTSKDRKLTKEKLIDSETTQDLWIRYETDTGQVYVKSRQFRRNLGKPLQQDLKDSTQYIGYTNKHFYAGTPYPSQLCACHVFNTKIAPSKRIEALGRPAIPEEKIASHRAYLMRMHGNDGRLVDVLMKEWVKDYNRPKRIVKNKRPKAENIAEQKRTTKKLKTRIEELEAWRNDMRSWAGEVKKVRNSFEVGGVTGSYDENAVEPITIFKLLEALSMRILASQTPTQDKPEKQPLDAISEYIKLHKPQIRTTITRLTKIPSTPHTEGAEPDPDYQTKLIPALVTLPDYDPRDHKLETIGRYVETVRLDGSGKKKTLYLHTVPLRDYLEKHYPSQTIRLKHDVRYTHSQNFKIHSLPSASGLYCAVFDMRRGRKPTENLKQNNEVEES